MSSKVLAALAIGSAIVPSAALAQTAQTTMDISATVVNACVVSATNLAFGNYDPTAGSPTDASSSITVTCTPGSSFTVGLNAGTTSGATVSNRMMASGSNRLDYALYSDVARTTNWGNTPGSDTPAAITAVSSPSILTVFGRVPAQQSVVAGSYTDTVTITVSY
ncbi:spore coat U domain-containing protein [Porphyrobacter sp. AAP60]|uniref:Csu type fimbrial protein n=1 Tax=Porphyrobacter sp. AAP60 TaxID=1523423 RepID=UPI0006B99E7E|nr:spore coat U domain-containing protein [Porphyrobacter sp. AAP60]KPF62166.1 spore coat protein [Porphyrobacter sp. AAP60]